jgi:hypothetical protein
MPSLGSNDSNVAGCDRVDISKEFSKVGFADSDPADPVDYF